MIGSHILKKENIFKNTQNKTKLPKVKVRLYGDLYRKVKENLVALIETPISRYFV